MSEQVLEPPVEEVASEIEKQLEGMGTMNPPEQAIEPEEAPPQEPPKEEIPAEAPPPPAEAPPAPADEELPELKPGENPTPEHWKKVREVTARYKDGQKQAQESVNQLQAKVAELEQRLQTRPQPQEQRPELSDEQVFHHAVTAREGGFDKDNKQIEIRAIEIIADMKPASVLKIIEQARRGEFGERSEAYYQLAREMLGEVNARAMLRNENRAAVTASTADFTARQNESYARARQSCPDLANPESEFAKFLPGWMEKNIGEGATKGNVSKPGPLHAVLQRPDWPERVIEYAQHAFRSARYATADKTAQDLQKKLDTMRTPQSGAHRNTAESHTATDTEKALIALGAFGSSNR